MDSLSQIVLGGAVGEAILGKKVGNKAVLWGALAGTIPDLDVIPGHFMETITRIEFHRSMTHSILFAIILSPLLAKLAHRIHQKTTAHYMEWVQLFFWGLFTHALLDCLTTWGTQLFWPFSDIRIAFNTVSVVDPVYTVPFLIFLIITMTKQPGSRIRSRMNTIGLTVSTSYLLLTFVNQSIMQNRFESQLNNQGIHYSRIEVMPTILNNVLWRAIAETQDGYFIGHASFFDKSHPIDFSFHLRHAELLNKLPDDDRIARLKKITNNYFIVRENEGTITLADLRFGQMAGWDSPQAPFIFQYEFQISQDKKLHISQPRPMMSYENGDQFISSLWRRIKGISFSDRSKSAPNVGG